MTESATGKQSHIKLKKLLHDQFMVLGAPTAEHIIDPVQLESIREILWETQAFIKYHDQVVSKVKDAFAHIGVNDL